MAHWANSHVCIPALTATEPIPSLTIVANVSQDAGVLCRMIVADDLISSRYLSNCQVVPMTTTSAMKKRINPPSTRAALPLLPHHSDHSGMCSEFLVTTRNLVSGNALILPHHQATDKYVTSRISMKSAPLRMIAKPEVPILKHSLERIASGDEFNDDSVNAYFEYLQQKYFCKDVRVIDTHFVGLVEKKGASAVLRMEKYATASAYSRVIIPIHSAHHWTLVFIDTASSRAFHYNSICESRPPERASTLCSELSDAWGIDIRDLITVHNLPLQETNVDCGAFMCEFAKRLCTGKNVCGFTQKNIPQVRRRLMEIIYYHFITLHPSYPS